MILLDNFSFKEVGVSKQIIAGISTFLGQIRF